MKNLLRQEKLAQEKEFKQRLEKEKFDDFDYIVEEVANTPYNSFCE